MFGSILVAVLAHKQVVIAAVAVTGLVMYAFPYNMMASANHGTQVNIQRNIEIPCLPYCNIANEPEPIDRTVGQGRVHIQIGFSFVPR